MNSAAPQTAREWLAYGIARVQAGHALKRWSPDTISVGGRCAQLVRESGEGCLDLPENTWPVALKAHDFRKARGGTDRWAADYEKAVRALNLDKALADVLIGDALYWPYTATVLIGKKRMPQAFGHTALYAGLIGGVPHVLENSDWAPASRKAQGARLPLGDHAHVYLTPLALLGTPSTVAALMPELLRDTARPILVPAPAPRPAAAALPAGWFPTRDPGSKALTGRYVSIQIGPQGPIVFEVPPERLGELK